MNLYIVWSEMEEEELRRWLNQSRKQSEVRVFFDGVFLLERDGGVSLRVCKSVRDREGVASPVREKLMEVDYGELNFYKLQVGKCPRCRARLDDAELKAARCRTCGFAWKGGELEVNDWGDDDDDLE